MRATNKKEEKDLLERNSAWACLGIDDQWPAEAVYLRR